MKNLITSVTLACLVAACTNNQQTVTKPQTTEVKGSIKKEELNPENYATIEEFRAAQDKRDHEQLVELTCSLDPKSDICGKVGVPITKDELVVDCVKQKIREYKQEHGEDQAVDDSVVELMQSYCKNA